jgi:DNA-binding CsgD family transcriptional regulator
MHQLKSDRPLEHTLSTIDVVASFFCPGEFYYFILNFYDNYFEYVHPDVEHVLGSKPENFSFNQIFEKMHPNDLENINWKEQAAAHFFYNELSPDKIPFYKSVYTFRIKNDSGGWKNILHQSMAIQLDEAKRIHYVLSIHSDITFINPLSDNQISFIGLQGEPSYYAISTDPNSSLQKKSMLSISDREKEIVKLLASGLSSKQIAHILHLSKHTVDTHRRNLLKKTNTQNTLELAALCMKWGVI